MPGLPEGLYETVEGIAQLLENPKQAFAAINYLLNSDDALGLLTDTVKKSYIARLDRMEAEYQRAGFEGSFNAGVESGKLLFDIVGSLAGGAGVAKFGVKVVDKITPINSKINNKPLGLGSTGRNIPSNLSEKLVLEQAISNPTVGRQLPVPMTDKICPASEGWVKMTQNINDIEIHYVRNTKTSEIDEFKFK